MHSSTVLCHYYYKIPGAAEPHFNLLGLLGRKAQVAGAAISVAQTDTGARTGGLLGTAAASGLMGHKGRMAAHAIGLGTSKGQGEFS